MVLVPLGVSMTNWARSIDPKSKVRTDHRSFTDDTGSNSFQRVGSTSHGTGEKEKKKISLGRMIKPKMVSPTQQMLEQTKEKEKRADGPDTSDISFNMAATSSGVGGKRNKSGSKLVKKDGGKKKRKKKRQSSSSSSSSSATGVRSTIKRLQRKRNSQLKTKLGASKKAAVSKKRKKSSV